MGRQFHRAGIAEEQPIRIGWSTQPSIGRRNGPHLADRRIRLGKQTPSFDTAGWFARDRAALARVSEVIFGEAAPAPTAPALPLAEDAFATVNPALNNG